MIESLFPKILLTNISRLRTKTNYDLLNISEIYKYFIFFFLQASTYNLVKTNGGIYVAYVGKLNCLFYLNTRPKGTVLLLE